MPNPLLGSLIDPFTSASLNTTVWNQSSGGGVVGIAAPGRAFVNIPTSTFYALGAGVYDATGQSISGKVTPARAGSGGAAVLTGFQLVVDSNNRVQFLVQPGVSFQAQVVTAGVTTATTLPAYDPAQHAWWRLREVGGSFAFDTSPDGAAWTTLATMAYTWSCKAMTFFLVAGSTDGTTGVSAYLEHVNTPLGGSTLLPSWPQIRFGVAFNQGANTSGQPSFVDLSSRLRGSWSAELSGRQYELDQVQSGQMSVSLWNLDGALDPLNTSSPYSPNVLPLRPARMQAVWPPTRNLLPQPIANATSTSTPQATVSNTAGSLALATGLAAAPTGHTTAFAWTLPASTTTGNTLGVGNASGGFATPDPAAVPVVAGSSYTFTCWAALAAGGDTTFQLSGRISWYDATGARTATNAVSGTTISVLGTWTLVSYTVTAPAGSVCARPGVMSASVPSSSTTVYTTAWQFEQAAAATPWTSGGVLYPLWQGFVERWPQQWDYSGTYGTVAITCVDALASLAQFTLQQSLTASLLADNPVRLMPLDEEQGATTFRDITGNHANATIGRSSLGAGTITAGNSVTGSGFIGASGPVVTIANPAATNFSQAGSFISLGGTGPNTSGAWSRFICFRTTTVPPAPAQASLWWWQASGNANQSQGGFYITSSGNLGASTENASGSSINTYIPGINVCDGNWHLAAMGVSADGKRLDISIDGADYFVTSTSNCQPTGIKYDTVGMNATPDTNFYTWPYSGDVAYVVDFAGVVSNTSDIAQGFATGWAGETSAARAQRILNIAGYQGKLSTLDATMPMGAANLSGVDAMSALQLVGDTENGQVYVDGAGTSWLAARAWRYLQSSATVTFGENAGEVPYLTDVAVELDDSHIYNDVTVDNQAAPNGTAQPGAHKTDTNSQAAYLPRSVQRTVNAQDSGVALAAAQYLVGQYAQPLARVSQLTVDGAANPALWSTILPLTFGTRADVKRRPPSGPGAAAMTVQQFIEHLTWNGDDQGNLKLGLQLSPAAPFTGWWVLSSLHTTVKTASTAGTATVTFNPLTGSASNPAAAVLAAGTQLTLGYGTANAETLTVKSVAATSAGYTSVAVTFTTNTTKNHAVGEMVCQPQPGSLTLPTAVQAGYPASLDAAATLSATTPRVAY